MKNYELLSKSELETVRGGSIWNPIGVVVALCAMAYQYGKDAAERERRLKGK